MVIMILAAALLLIASHFLHWALLYGVGVFEDRTYVQHVKLTCAAAGRVLAHIW